MSHVAELMSELDRALLTGSSERRVQIMRAVTDLFVDCAERVTAAHVAVFDVVIARIAEYIENAARIALSERLADVNNAPHGVVRRLAHDTLIEIARPVLTRSKVLTDADLISVARERGTEHRVAIARRERVSPAVTDVLVEVGDGDVLRTVTANFTASISDSGFGQLLSVASDDAALLSELVGRHDVPAKFRDTILAIAQDLAKKRLQAQFTRQSAKTIQDVVIAKAAEVSQILAVAQKDVVKGAARPGSAGADDEIKTAVAETLDLRHATLAELETHLAQQAARGDRQGAVALLARLSNVSVDIVEGVFQKSDQDLLLVLCRSRGLAWSTAQGLLTMMLGQELDEGMVFQKQKHYEGLSKQSSQRVIRFLHIRESTKQRQVA